MVKIGDRYELTINLGVKKVGSRWVVLNESNDGITVLQRSDGYIEGFFDYRLQGEFRKIKSKKPTIII